MCVCVCACVCVCFPHESVRGVGLDLQALYSFRWERAVSAVGVGGVVWIGSDFCLYFCVLLTFLLCPWKCSSQPNQCRTDFVSMDGS